METWFTSDQHFGHKNIIEYCDRPYNSVGEMNEALIANWIERVAPGDLVFVPGDVVMGRKEESLPLLARLTGYIVVLPGNHDPCWFGSNAGAKLARGRAQYLDNGVAEIIDTGAGHGEPTVEIAGQTVKMSHFPYIGDSRERQGEDKFSAYRPEDDGSWLIHGHVHDAWKVKDRMINVGVDVWDYCPVHIDELAAIIDG